MSNTVRTVFEEQALRLAEAVVPTAERGRDLDIRQGVGSQLPTRSGADGTVGLGGRVEPDEGGRE